MIAILFNRRAGKQKGKSILQLVEIELLSRSIPYEVFTDVWPICYEKFHQIWIIGGDGTLNYFINNFNPKDKPLAIFKGGTGNDFAWMLYKDITIREQVDLLLHTSPKPIDAGVCNDKLFINTIGIGFDGMVLGLMPLIRWLGSRLGYHLAVLWTIFSFKEPSYRLKLKDEASLLAPFLLLMVSNAPRTAGGFLISPLAEPTDGMLNLLTCKPLNIWKRFQLLPLTRSGKHINQKPVDHRLITEIIIESSTVQKAQLDGELIESDIFNCRVSPAHFQFLY